MSRPRTPEGLGKAGRAFWLATVRVYELSPAEVTLLEEACRVKDLLGRVTEQLAAGDLLVDGSMGQDRANPLLRESVELRKVLNMLLLSLALPMPDEVAGRVRSPQAQAAAQARWRSQGVGV